MLNNRVSTKVISTNAIFVKIPWKFQAMPDYQNVFLVKRFYIWWQWEEYDGGRIC